MKKNVITLWMLIISASLLFSGCVNKEALGITDAQAAMADDVSPAEQATAPDETAGTQTEDIAQNNDISIENSVSLQDFSLRLAEAYGAEKSVNASATTVGQDAALLSVRDGNCDFAIYSGSSDDAVASDGLTTEVIGSETVRLITGGSSERKDISIEEINMMFTAMESFGFYAEEESSETSAQSIALTAEGTPSRILFEELFGLRGDVNGMIKTLIPDTANVFETDAEVIEYVNSNPETVGVLCAPELPADVTALTIDGVSADDAGYPGSREIILAYKQDNAKAADFISFTRSSNGVSK